MKVALPDPPKRKDLIGKVTFADERFPTDSPQRFLLLKMKDFRSIFSSPIDLPSYPGQETKLVLNNLNVKLKLLNVDMLLVWGNFSNQNVELC